MTTRSFALLNDARDFNMLSQIEKDGGEAGFLCISPTATYLAEKQGYRHVNIDSYLRKPDEEARIGFENKNRAARLVKYFADSFNSIIGDCSEDIFESFFFSFSCLLDNYLNRFLMMHSFLRDRRPSVLFLPVQGQEVFLSKTHWKAYNEYDEPLIFEAARHFRSDFSYRLVEISVKTERTYDSLAENDKGVFRAIARNFKDGAVDIASRFVRTKGIIYGGGETSLIGKTFAGLNMWIWCSPDSGRLIHEPKSWIKSKEFKILYEALEHIKFKSADQEAVLTDDRLEALLRFGEISLYAILRPKFELLLKSLIVDVLRVYFLILHLCRTRKLSFFISGTPTQPYYTAMLLASRRLGVRNVICQHGGGYGYFSNGIAEMFYKEIRYGDIFLTWGDGIVEYALAKPFGLGNTKCSIISAGSLGVRAFQKKLNSRQHKKRKRSIFYVPTSFAGDYRRLLYHCYPDGWYFSFQRRLLTELAKQGANVVYKAHYKGQYASDNPVITFIKDSGITNVRISGAPLQDVAHEADAFVIDSPTTTFIQALLSSKPVWCFVNEALLPFCSQARGAFEAACHFFTNEEEFLSELVKSYKDGTPFIQSKDPYAFIERYARPIEKDWARKKIQPLIYSSTPAI